jgi:hypothetical protein
VETLDEALPAAFRALHLAGVARAAMRFWAIRAGPGVAAPRSFGESLEDLMNVEVTSVSKKQQKLSRTASAVFVARTTPFRGGR